MSDVGGWERDRLREQLVARGFADDGVCLRGPVTWTHPAVGQVVARVEIEPDGRFPFAPPQVRLLDAGHLLEMTFHIDRPTRQNGSGNLCLWNDEWPVDQAPWIDPAQLLARIANWLEQTAAGWPDDDVCDLERYLEQDINTLVLYDAEGLANVVGTAVRTASGPTPHAVVVTSAIRRVKSPSSRRGLRRKDRRLAWVDDLGEVQKPIRGWSDIKEALGARTVTLARYITLDAVNLLLLRYQRGRHHSILALKVERTTKGIEVWACESADTSTKTRQLRAGQDAPDLADAKIAIVGCGAVGSFAADILFRSGVRHLTLIDPERLRPGNVVRHLAGSSKVGSWKVEAVRDCLAETDEDIGAVRAWNSSVATLAEASELLRHHHVILDATGSARGSSLLAVAADNIGPGTGHVVVSACVQREGDIVRVDRLPSRRGDTYLPPLPADEKDHRLRERGCGDPVSRTSPSAAIAAAELACRVVIDEATRACMLPASLMDVRCAQPLPPYDRVGLHFSPPQPDGGT